ncbi:MAG: potassium channel protein [Bdellovibrionales bacterium]|nr:potassium channel protein [Bdellovibrionales bacterium]
MEFRKSSFFIVSMLIVILFFGVWGYSLIEGWGFNDSLYMTLITLTTTGFQEVHPMSPQGRFFTMILLILGMGTVAYSVTHLMQDLMSINFNERRRRKMQKKIAQLEKHIIVCGFGRMGKVVCQELHSQGVPFVVIEKFDKSLKELEHTPYLWLEGDATHDESLLAAGIDRAKTVASMVDCDADSLYISLAVKSLNPKVTIVARANDESARQKIHRAGADKVVMPITVSGIKVAQTLINPIFEDVLDIEGVDPAAGERVQMTEIMISESSDLFGKNLANCGLKRRGFMVVGIRHPEGDFTFAPNADYNFRSGDVLVSLTTPETQSEIIKVQKPH